MLITDYRYFYRDWMSKLHETISKTIYFNDQLPHYIISFLSKDNPFSSWLRKTRIRFIGHVYTPGVWVCLFGQRFFFYGWRSSREKRGLVIPGIDQKYISLRYDSAECFSFGDVAEGWNGSVQGEKKNKKKRQRRERERERDTDTFFFLPSVESDYTKGAGIPAHTKGVFDYL